MVDAVHACSGRGRSAVEARHVVVVGVAGVQRRGSRALYQRGVFCRGGRGHHGVGGGEGARAAVGSGGVPQPAAAAARVVPAVLAAVRRLRLVVMAGGGGEVTVRARKSSIEQIITSLKQKQKSGQVRYGAATSSSQLYTGMDSNILVRVTYLTAVLHRQSRSQHLSASLGRRIHSTTVVRSYSVHIVLCTRCTYDAVSPTRRRRRSPGEGYANVATGRPREEGPPSRNRREKTVQEGEGGIRRRRKGAVIPL